MAKVYDFNAALKAKRAAQSVNQPVVLDQLALQLNTDRADLYTPEMGETANPTKLIHGQLCYSKYTIDWLPENDATVRQLCKELRIKLDSLELYQPGDRTYTPFGKGVSHYSAMITYKGWNKLRERGVTTLCQPLD